MAMEGNLEMGQEFFMEIWNGYERSKELEEENKTLKNNVEFLHSCLDDRDKSIAIMQEENRNLKEDSKKLESAIGDMVRENRKLKEENKKLQNDLETVSGVYFDR